MAAETVAVLTSDLIRFEIQATHWLTESIRNGADGPINYRTRLFVAGDSNPVAEFTDVHAVWRLSKGDIIPPDDE